MIASVTYWDGGNAVRSEGLWDWMPLDGVLWVTVQSDGWTHRLLGADGYWVIAGTAYGMTYEDAQPRYGGRLYAAYGIMAGEAYDLGEKPPPPSARVLRGIQIPDEDWERIQREHGLIRGAA